MRTLQSEKCWCVWKYENRNGYMTKVPYISPDVRGSSSEPENWQAFEAMKALCDEHEDIAGLGIFLSTREQDEKMVLGAIDIDAHHTDGGDGNSLANEILAMFSGTYTELSPSGNGYHILFNMEQSKIPLDSQGRPTYKQKNSALELEIYIGTVTNRYMTFTGKRVSTGENITDQTDTVLSFIGKFMRQGIKERAIRKASIPPANVTYREALNSEEITKRLKEARKGKKGEEFIALYDRGEIPQGLSHSEADWRLLSHLIYWLGHDPTAIDQAFRASALMRPKWDDTRHGETYGEYRIRTALDTYNVFHPFSGVYGDSVCHLQAKQEVVPIIEMINRVANDEEHKELVSILPLLCGMGKSTAISQVIRQTLAQEKEGHHGLVVITDRIARLHEYMEPYDPELRSYLQRHKNDVSIIDADSIKTGVLHKQHKHPILMMTTQRYFSLSHEEVISFLTWQHGDRPLVLIDERPETRTNVTFDATTIGILKAAIKRTFQSHNSNVAVAFDYLLRELEMALNIIQRDCTELPRYRFFFKPDPDILYNITDNEEDILDKLSHERMTLGQVLPRGIQLNTFQILHGMLDMSKEPALVHNQREKGAAENPRYHASMHMMTNNQHCIQNIPAKVIILDGTAEISPEYLLDNYDFREEFETKRSLEHLKIKIINLNTTRYHLDQSEAYQAMVRQAVKQYVDNAGIRADPQWALFTYQDHLKAMNDIVDAPVSDYFGDIVGKNDFRNAKHIVQVGLNRYPDWVYFRILLDQYPEFKAQLKDINENWRLLSTTAASSLEIPYELIESESQLLKQFEIEHMHDLNDITNRSLFAECEQMIFRGIIRNADCSEDYYYHLFIDLDHYECLYSMMLDRYLPLGAQIEVLEKPPIYRLFDLMKGQGRQSARTQVQKLVHWHDSILKSGNTYTDRDLMVAAGAKNRDAWRKFKSIHKDWLVAMLKADCVNDCMKGEEARYCKTNNWFI